MGSRDAVVNFYPRWSPRFWHGMRMGDWLRLLARNRFRVHPIRWSLAATVTGASLANSGMALVQSLWHGRSIQRTTVAQPPVFVLGHWRSGTTLLHELLACDSQFAWPTTWECFAPTHCMVSERWLGPAVGLLLPKRRPMDNMGVGIDRPQEDELAMVTLGAPTPYLRMAFPNHAPVYDELIDMQDLPADELARWASSLEWFIRLLTYRKSKRVLLKSPGHTGRLRVLHEMFPGAKFVHVVRDPVQVFTSTRRLWRSLDYVQGLQLPRHDGLDEYILRTFERMYTAFAAAVPRIAESHICHVRYEDLVQQPVDQLKGIYDQLELGDFESVRAAVAERMDRDKAYSPNRNELEPELAAEVRRRWSGYLAPWLAPTSG